MNLGQTKQDVENAASTVEAVSRRVAAEFARSRGDMEPEDVSAMHHVLRGLEQAQRLTKASVDFVNRLAAQVADREAQEKREDSVSWRTGQGRRG